MSLLDSVNTIKRFLKPGIISLIPVFLGCETSEDIGVEYDLETGANVRFVEFTLPATNTYVDSLRTDSENRILVGRYTDELSGTIEAESYFELFYLEGPLPSDEATTEVPDPQDTLKLDSVVFEFKGSSLIPMEGSVVQDFGIYELADSLISSAIYLSRTQLTKGNLIGTIRTLVDGPDNLIFRSRLSDEFATSLFDELSQIAKDPDISLGDLDRTLAISPHADSESITLFDFINDTSRVMIYTSPVDPAQDTSYVSSLRIFGKNYTYLDRKEANYGSSVANEGSDIELPDGQLTIDPLYGLTTTATLDQLATFFEQNPDIIINNATLSLAFESESNRDTLENFYSFFYRDNDFFGPGVVDNPFRNIIMSDAAFLSGQNAPAISQLSDDEDEILISATLFFQSLYRNYIEEGLLVVDDPLSDDTPSAEELIFISQRDVTLQRTVLQSDGIKLKIFYTEVN